MNVNINWKKISDEITKESGSEAFILRMQKLKKLDKEDMPKKKDNVPKKIL